MFRIMLLSDEYGVVADLHITPTVDTEYITKSTVLQSTTECYIWISACSNKNYCYEDVAVHSFAVTNRRIKSVTKANIEQLGGNNTCFVSWEWPYITSEVNVMQFKVIIRSGSNTTSSNEDIRFVNITTSNYLYSFEPQPCETYNVEIQSVESVGSCKAYRANGSCIGKDQDPCMTVNSATPYVQTCIATGSIEPHVEWRRDGNVVSNTSDQTIYQTKDQGIATLNYKNATIGDVGEYLCAAWIDIRKEKVSAPKQIKVNGTPSIINIESFKCNSSLLITWKPSLGALGFPHRIFVLSNEKEILAAHLFITPTVDTDYFTEITDLQSTIEYSVQVAACDEKYRCSDDYTVYRDATTNGIIKSVINAGIKQLGGNNTCIVSWEWPYITPEDNVTQFKITIRSGSTATSSNEDIRFVNIKTSNYLYYFEPQPSETYNVGIQSIESVGSCKTVRAIGSCIGKDANILVVVIPIIAGVVLLFIVVLVVVLPTRKKRKNTTTRNTTTNVTSEVNNRLNEVVYSKPEHCDVHQYEAVPNVQITAGQSNVEVVYNNINPTIALASDVYEYDN